MITRPIVAVILQTFLYAGFSANHASAAEIKVLCTTALSAPMGELAPAFERESGNKLMVSYALTADLKKRIDGGEAFDVAVLLPAAADELAKSGKAVAGSAANIGRYGLGLAVRAGSANSDISTVDAFKKAILDAKSIVITRGPSGTHFLAVSDRLGVGDGIKPKTKVVNAGEAIPAVAKGEVDVGIDVIPQIVTISGVAMRPFPDELQSYTPTAAILGTNAKEATAAQAFISFLTGPNAAAVLKSKGIEPGR